MKTYNEKILMSEQFYHRFYLPDLDFKSYISREKFLSNMDGGEDKIVKEINDEYLYLCEQYFKPNILFYRELSEHIIDNTMNFRPLDEYVFLKLRLYAVKFYNIINDGVNFLTDERQKFILKNYDEAIIMLSKTKFHDANAFFQYHNNVLQICYKFGTFESIFEFHGVKDWEEKKFMKEEPTLIIEEVYEEPNGLFVYNTLWSHKYIEGEN